MNLDVLIVNNDTSIMKEYILIFSNILGVWIFLFISTIMIKNSNSFCYMLQLKFNYNMIIIHIKKSYGSNKMYPARQYIMINSLQKYFLYHHQKLTQHNLMISVQYIKVKLKKMNLV